MSAKYLVLYSFVRMYSIAIASNQSEWTLVWNDEFSGDRIDLSKWNVDDELHFCQGSYNQQLHCHTSNPRNIRQTNGVLAITAIKEKHLNKEFTSGQISTKFVFTYGRVDIRASLPNGKMLRPAIWLYPQNASNEWPKSGQIDMMTNVQYPQIASGVHYSDGVSRYLGNNNNEYRVSANSSLSDYHIYQLEWTTDHIKWSFDGYPYFSVDINRKFGQIYARNGQPFDHNFKIFLHLGIGGGIFFPNIALTERDVIDWNCSLFIIDYIRIYQLANTNTTTTNIDNVSNRVPLLVNTNSSVNSICLSVMPEIAPVKNETLISNNLNTAMVSNDYIWLTIVINVVLVLLFAMMFIFWRIIVKRRRKSRKIVERKKGEQRDSHYLNENYYADVKYEDENYETINDNYYQLENIGLNDYEPIGHNEDAIDKNYTAIF